MKLTINRLVLSLTIAIIPFYLSAARMFILFNEDCMERLEYESVNKNTDPFVAYQINVGDGEKVILEIGQESKNTTTKLPTPTIGCDNGAFNLPMVQKINSRIDEVFLVVKRNNRKYTVSPVNFATYFSVKEDVISVISPKYKFQFDTKDGAIGENISTEKTADVFFQGRMEQECTGAYVFRQIAQGSRTPYTDLVLIPEVGIIEMRSGQTLDQALTNGMRLEKVNDDSFEDYLEEKCEESLSDNVLANSKPSRAKEAEVTPSGAIGYDMTVKNGNVRQRVNPSANQPSSSSLPNTVNRGSTSNNTALSPGGTNQYHTVKKGETLYRISKKYDISVGQIKSWNSLNSNLITTGSQLMVGTQAVAVDNAVNNNTATTNQQSDFANNNSNKPRYFPAPYNTTYRPNGSNEVLTNKGVAESYQVKPGDTVASLAMRFGFTEKKFREINQLGNSDFIKIGQALKTSDCNCPTNSNNTPTVEAPQEFNFVQKGSDVSADNFDTPTANRNTVDSPRNYPVNFSDTPIPVSSSNFTPPSEMNSTRSPSPMYAPRGIDQQDANSNPYEAEQNTPRTTRQPSPYDAIIPNSFDTYSPIRTGSSDQAVRGLDSAPQNSNRKRHVVQEGEDIFRIARMYNMTTERLRTLNQLELGEVIIPTQKLFIE